MGKRAFDHRFGSGLAVFFQNMTLQRARVDADPHRAPVVARRFHHFGHTGTGTDVAGIDTQARSPCFGGLDGAAVMKMDIGHDRHPGFTHDCAQRRGRVLVGAGDAHDVGAGVFQRPHLLESRRGIGREGIGHRLDRYRCAAADGDTAHPNLPGDATINVSIGSEAHGGSTARRRTAAGADFGAFMGDFEGSVKAPGRQRQTPWRRGSGLLIARLSIPRRWPAALG